jgi:hypothetical protein
LELRKFDLKLAFMGLGVLGEDVENERGAVEDADIVAKRFLQFTLMAWRKLIIEEDDVGIHLGRNLFDFLDLTRPDECVGVGVFEALAGAADNLQTGGIGQALQLIQTIVERHQRAARLEFGPDQEGAFLRLLGIGKLSVAVRNRIPRINKWGSMRRNLPPSTPRQFA